VDAEAFNVEQENTISVQTLSVKVQEVGCNKYHRAVI